MRTKELQRGAGGVFAIAWYSIVGVPTGGNRTAQAAGVTPLGQVDTCVDFVRVQVLQVDGQQVRLALELPDSTALFDELIS